MAGKRGAERRPKRRRPKGDETSGKIEDAQKAVSEWVPATEIGKKVKNGEIESIDDLFSKNIRILEPEIVDVLLPNLTEKLVDFKKTTKVRRSGRMFSFRATVLVGDGNQYIGLGTAKDRERWPAIRKATRSAKMNLVKVVRGCGSWECPCGEPHSIPFKLTGKSASVRVFLIPAPKGAGLVVGNNIKDVFKFAGVKDVWSKTKGNTGSKLDFILAAIDALSNTTKMRAFEKTEKVKE